MAWLSRVNFISSDTLSFTDINNLGNDIRAWGDNVNGGGYTLSNVVLSASAGTMATVIGGTSTTSTLRLRSTSGVGATGADIIFQTGNNGATEVMRLQNGGNVGIGTTAPVSSARLDLTKSITVGSLSTMRQLRIGVDSNPDYSGYIGYGDNSAGFYGLVLQGLHANVATASFIALQPSGGNVSVGGMAARATTVGTNVFNIFDGIAPVGTLANGCSFYSTAGEMRVMDAAGNATLLSPHDSQTNEWIYDSTHTPSGKRLRVRVEALLRFINEHFGLDFILEEN